jgi:uncharacterized membrane protein YfcA
VEKETAMKLNKKALTVVYWGTLIGGVILVIIGSFLLGIGENEHLNYALGALSAVAIGIVVFKSWEDYQRAQREELRREIREAVRRGILESSFTHTHAPQNCVECGHPMHRWGDCIDGCVCAK